MAFPTVTYWLALGDDPLEPSPTWTEIPETDVEQFTFVSSGRNLDTDDFEGGSGSITLRNDSGDYTPGNTSSPHSPYIRLRMPIKVEATRGSSVLTIRGYVDATPVSFPNPPSQSLCEWPIVDAFTLLEEMEADYPWKVVVRNKAPKLWHQFGELSGTQALDSSGNGNHGIYWNDPTLQVEFGTGTGATFNGTSQYVTVNTSAAITGTGDFWIEWFADLTTTAGVLYQQWDNTAGITGLQVEISGVGLVIVTTADAGGSTTTNGTTNIGSGAEYHVIFRRQGTTHELIVNGVIDGTTVGTVRNIPAPTHCTLMARTTPSLGNFLIGTIDEFVLGEGPLTAAEATGHYEALLAWHAQLAGEQIDNALDAFGWPSGERDIDAGNSYVLGQFAPSGSVLDMIRLSATSDFGAIYVTLDGTIRFRERQAIMLPPYTTSQGTFGNNEGAGHLPVVIRSLKLDYDASRIKNDVTLRVNWQTGPIESAPYQVTVRKTDASSIAAYGARTWSREVYTMALGGTSATALVLSDFADLILTRYKDPLREVRSLRLTPHEASSTAFWDHILLRTQEDRITHSHTAPGGEVISGDYHIQRIRHSIGPGKVWRTEWDLTPADTQAFWIWGTSEWDETTRWGA